MFLSSFENLVKKDSKCAEEFYNSKVYTWEWAASKGKLEIIKWLHYHDKPGCSERVMDLAAEFNHLEIIKFLHYNRTEGCTKAAMNLAGINGNIEVFKWLYNNRTEGFSTHSISECTEHLLHPFHFKYNSNCIECGAKWLKRNRTMSNLMRLYTEHQRKNLGVLKSTSTSKIQI